MVLELILINLSVMLGIATIIIHFSFFTSDPKWERRTGAALLFVLVPMAIMRIVRLLKWPIPPLFIAGVIWVLMAVLFYMVRKKRQYEVVEAMQNIRAWKCPRCGEYNPKLELECEKCGEKKPEAGES